MQCKHCDREIRYVKTYIRYEHTDTGFAKCDPTKDYDETDLAYPKPD